MILKKLYWYSNHLDIAYDLHYNNASLKKYRHAKHMESLRTVNTHTVEAPDAPYDEPLIRAAQQGDRQAYQALYEQYHRRVYALCYRLTADTGLAEDATQEVFIQLWRKLNAYAWQSRFTTWLHSVATNITLSYMRKQKSWVVRMLNIETSPEGQELDANRCTSEIDLEALIVRLPERARVVFVLHAVEGYRHDEIATLLNIATGTSKTQFHRARRMLTQWLEGEDYGQ